MEFPSPPDLEVDFVHRTGDSRPKSFQQYSVENPHPGYGKDPNILNELGHTKYPMWIYPNGPGTSGIIVNDVAEEARHYKPEVSVPTSAWPTK